MEVEDIDLNDVCWDEEEPFEYSQPENVALGICDD